MKKFAKPLGSLFLILASLSHLSCQNALKISDISPGVTLPYSGNCFQVSTLTGKVKETPKAECDKIKAKSLFITTEDYKKLRKDTQNNCAASKSCTQITTPMDELMLLIDSGLDKALP